MNGIPTIHLIHGFNEKHSFEDGPSIKVMQEHLANGYKVHTWDYGHANLIDVRTNNDNYSRLIASTVEPGDILVGYSNGAAIIQTMLEQFDCPAQQIFLLHPAISKTWQAPEFVKKVFIFYNKFDKAVIAGKWWRRASRGLPWNWFSENRNHWGELGKTGYTGPFDRRVTQFDTYNTEGMPQASGHGGLFGATIYKEWALLIKGLMLDGDL